MMHVLVYKWRRSPYLELLEAVLVKLCLAHLDAHVGVQITQTSCRHFSSILAYVLLGEVKLEHIISFGTPDTLLLHLR